MSVENLPSVFDSLDVLAEAFVFVGDTLEHQQGFSGRFLSQNLEQSICSDITTAPIKTIGDMTQSLMNCAGRNTQAIEGMFCEAFASRLISESVWQC